MNTEDKEQLRQFVNATMVAGLRIPFTELRPLFENGNDPAETITAALGDVTEEYCDCGGENCPGVKVTHQGQELELPSFAAAARFRGLTPLDFIDLILAKREQHIQAIVELYEVIEDMDVDEVTGEFIESQDPQVLEAVMKYRIEFENITLIDEFNRMLSRHATDD